MTDKKIAMHVEETEEPRESGKSVPAPLLVSGQEYAEIDTRSVAEGVPLIPGGIVVYLGNNPKRQQSWPGRLFVESYEDEDGTIITRKEPAEVGNEAYNFVTHDSRGRAIKLNRFMQTDNVRYRGKPFESCEHGDHLRLFRSLRLSDGTPEFAVIVPRQYAEVFRAYVERLNKRQGKREVFHKEIISG